MSKNRNCVWIIHINYAAGAVIGAVALILSIIRCCCCSNAHSLFCSSTIWSRWFMSIKNIWGIARVMVGRTRASVVVENSQRESICCVCWLIDWMCSPRHQDRIIFYEKSYHYVDHIYVVSTHHLHICRLLHIKIVQYMFLQMCSDNRINDFLFRLYKIDK